MYDLSRMEPAEELRYLILGAQREGARALTELLRPALPAIAVTAYANPEDRVRALVAGYQNHVPKPVDANVLAASIAKLVAH